MKEGINIANGQSGGEHQGALQRVGETVVKTLHPAAGKIYLDTPDNTGSDIPSEHIMQTSVNP